MPNTYTELLKTTVGTATPSVTLDLTGISGYTDLVIVASILPSVSTNQPYIQFNADTGTSTTNYSTTSVRGDGSSAASGRHTNQFGWFPVPGPGIGTNGNPEPWLINIMNYANTTTFKSGISRFNNAASIVSANAHLWRSTAAITSITITMESGNFNTNSTFSLYGIANADQGAAKATGGIITEDSQYWYHTFGASGTFTPKQSISADVLVVAGGGAGGGPNAGGGGGAGGVAFQASRSLVVSNYSVTIGGGGAGTTSSTSNSGNNSIFDTITANGGGGSVAYGNGTAGGSGGGGSYNSGSGGAATQGSSGGATGFGNAGGLGPNTGNQGAGGGGGAGAVGAAGTSTNGGNGGSGLSTWSSWLSTTGIGVSGFIAGGGGGAIVYGTSGSSGDGGAGGGGKGGIYATPNLLAASGIANTGSGGGGGGSAISGAGGSGVVIIRYSK